MTLILLSLFALWTATTFDAAFANASAAPSVLLVQSLNYQLPWVARVGQPYSWTVSSDSFNSTDGPITYSTSTLPTWITFDNSSLTFQGTPGTNDKGYPEILVTAHGLTTSTSSRFTICVTDAPMPTLDHPLDKQLDPNSRAMSSIYALRPGSALKTSNPTVRVSPKSSFSIGLDSTTYGSPAGKNLFYELRRPRSQFLPDWVNFNSETVTVDAVAPSYSKSAAPEVVDLELHASDQEGYTAAVAPFSIVVAEHELSMPNATLPTINITLGNPFVFNMGSAADLTGVLVDERPIHPSDISDLVVDTSQNGWVHFDNTTRSLAGTAPDSSASSTPVLPVAITTNFGQTVHATVSFNLVESYFVLPVLPSIRASKGDVMEMSLTQYVSKSSPRPGSDGTNITANFEPPSAADELNFDDSSVKIAGKLQNPGNVTITFTAFSSITHTTSHTSLTIYVVDTQDTKTLAPTKSGGMTAEAHKKMVLALLLTFGLIGGLCAIAGIFALVRRWARVEDTALAGEEGRHAWSEKDRQWYGMALSPNGTRIIEKNEAPVTMNNIPSPGPSRPRGPRPNYTGLGLGRIQETSSEAEGEGDSSDKLVSPGVISKQEFMAKLRATVRQVSNKYGSKKQPAAVNRAVIGKPILVSSTRASAQPEMGIHPSPSNPFDDSMAISSRPGSTFLSGSPSNSTAGQSIPKRRADFNPPRNPAQVHFQDSLLARQVSSGSMGATSCRSEKSGISAESILETAMGPPTRPRLVPFTSSTRVPVPDLEDSGFNGNRIASQRAKVVKPDSNSEHGVVTEETDIKMSATSDDISMGIHYVRSLGDQLAVNPGGRSPSPALSNIRSSFTSLESSHLGHKSGNGPSATKVIARTGERFKFRVPVQPELAKGTKRFSVKLTSGLPLPKYIRTDLNGIVSKGVLELSGVAGYKDLGELCIGVYAEPDGECVASIVFEVVSKR